MSRVQAVASVIDTSVGAVDRGPHVAEAVPFQSESPSSEVKGVRAVTV